MAETNTTLYIKYNPIKIKFKKELASRIYKEISKLNSKKKEKLNSDKMNNPIKISKFYEHTPYQTRYIYDK